MQILVPSVVPAAPTKRNGLGLPGIERTMQLLVERVRSTLALIGTTVVCLLLLLYY